MALHVEQKYMTLQPHMSLQALNYRLSKEEAVILGSSFLNKTHFKVNFYMGLHSAMLRSRASVSTASNSSLSSCPTKKRRIPLTPGQLRQRRIDCHSYGVGTSDSASRIEKFGKGMTRFTTTELVELTRLAGRVKLKTLQITDEGTFSYALELLNLNNLNVSKTNVILGAGQYAYQGHEYEKGFVFAGVNSQGKFAIQLRGITGQHMLSLLCSSPSFKQYLPSVSAVKLIYYVCIKSVVGALNYADWLKMTSFLCSREEKIPLYVAKGALNIGKSTGSIHCTITPHVPYIKECRGEEEGRRRTYAYRGFARMRNSRRFRSKYIIFVY